MRDYTLERAVPFASEIITDSIENLLVFKKAGEPGKSLCSAPTWTGRPYRHRHDDEDIWFDLSAG